MATKTVRIDDYDGAELSDDIEPLKVKVGSDTFNLDLSAANTAKFMDWLEGKSGPLAPKSGSSTRSRSASPAKSGENLEAIRTWARENGHEVSDRGRIAKAVKDAYYAAQG